MRGPTLGGAASSLERFGMDPMRDLVADGGHSACWRRTATGSLVSPRTTDLG
jgi:hypothetical protein